MSIATPDIDESLDLSLDPGRPLTWQTVVWNDPVNLLSYVVHVFRSYFGFTKERATALMLDVHERGRAIVATGPREQMELHALAMHGYGLWATVQPAPA